MATQQEPEVEEEEEQQRKRKLELELEDYQDEEHQQQELSLSVCSDSVDLDNTNNDDQNNKNMNNNNKTGRLPRWTRQEILVLIQGKKVAENRVQRGRTAAALSNCCVEPKWATVSSYCMRHGVNRGAVQCRKRWSNLAADFKKIKDWESHNDSSDSFWLMRNDLRRERKLPGFFDKEVYDILDGNMDLQPPPDSPPPPPPLLFDSCRTTPADDALFSDIDAQQQLHPAVPISIPAPTPISGADEEKQAEVESTSQGERKRKRHVMEDEKEGETRSLLQVMEKNGRMLSAQLEAHNINLKLDRDDRKDHADSLVAVLNKLADAFARIADKL